MLWNNVPLQMGRETLVHVAQKFCIQRRVLLYKRIRGWLGSAGPITHTQHV